MLVLAVAAGSACSDRDDGAATARGTSAGDAAGDDAGSSGGATPPPERGSDSPSPTFTGEDSEEYCARYLAYVDTFNRTFDPASPPAPEELDDAYAAIVTALDDLAAVASSEIAADVEVVATAFGAILPQLAQVSYVFDALPLDVQQEFASDANTTAQGRLDAYGSQVCGLGSSG